jgi:hypothetical protein
MLQILPHHPTLTLTIGISEMAISLKERKTTIYNNIFR